LVTVVREEEIVSIPRAEISSDAVTALSAPSVTPPISIASTSAFVARPLRSILNPSSTHSAPLQAYSLSST